MRTYTTPMTAAAASIRTTTKIASRFIRPTTNEALHHRGHRGHGGNPLSVSPLSSVVESERLRQLWQSLSPVEVVLQDNRRRRRVDELLATAPVALGRRETLLRFVTRESLAFCRNRQRRA